MWVSQVGQTLDGELRGGRLRGGEFSLFFAWLAPCADSSGEPEGISIESWENFPAWNWAWGDEKEDED